MRNIGLDFDDCNIANNNGVVIINGNGVMSGVGLIGNATHDHIISKMGANTSEVGKEKKKRNYLQRFWRAYLKNFTK